MTKISHIAIVASGVYVGTVPEGDAKYLQVNDFNIEKDSSFATIELDDYLQRHLLEEGDILFAAKGDYNFSVIYHAQMGASVASLSFLVIRIKDKTVVDPEYLCWFLNKKDTLYKLKNHAAGTSIQSIRKSVVEDCEIDIPLISVQKKVVEIANLQQRERLLYSQIAEQRELLTQKQIMEIIKIKDNEG